WEGSGDVHDLESLAGTSTNDLLHLRFVLHLMMPGDRERNASGHSVGNPSRHQTRRMDSRAELFVARDASDDARSKRRIASGLHNARDAASDEHAARLIGERAAEIAELP